MFLIKLLGITPFVQDNLSLLSLTLGTLRGLLPSNPHSDAQQSLYAVVIREQFLMIAKDQRKTRIRSWNASGFTVSLLDNGEQLLIPEVSAPWLCYYFNRKL